MKTKYVLLLLIHFGLLSCEAAKPTKSRGIKTPIKAVSKAAEKTMKDWVKLSHPGGPKAPKALIAKFKQAVAIKADKKKAFRTKHKENGLPLFTNRLVLESSPYLQQHAHNPVNWYSWGDEAFEIAAHTGRPVFLSIGYSTCHWCHVMEEESFEDLEIAKYLNENYIAIKVDREERPDIDDIYMKAVTIFTGRGGWPMSVWLTEDRTPYDGGTYFPARTGDRGSRIGYLELLKKNKAAYSDPATFVKAQLTTEKIAKNLVVPAAPNARLEKRNAPLIAAVTYLTRSFDSVNGGWGRTNKFPMPSRLRFLLRYYRRSGEKPDMLFHTLDAMAAGGIYDQVGGGFHRYTVDPKWTVPHFEKMLYDNAQLALLYTEAYQFTGDENYKRVAIETLDYLEREMVDANGALFAATDADSGGEEGTFFIWTETEFDALFPEGSDSKLAAFYFGVTRRGNFEGKNILTRRRTDEVLKKFSIDQKVLDEKVAMIRARLYEARKSKTPPDRDDKIITAWNALAAEAFAAAGFVFSENRFTARAEKILTVIDTSLYKDGILYRSGISTDAVGPHHGFKKGPMGVAEDYAFTIHAALKMFQYSGELRWLKQAEKLQTVFDENFMKGNRVYHRRSKIAPPALVNEEAWKDGAVPSANGYAAMNALIWQRVTTDPKWDKRTDQIFGAYASRFRRSPLSSTTMLVALDGYTDKSKEVFVVGNPQAEMVEQLRAFHPNVTFFTFKNAASEEQIRAVPWLAKKLPKGGKATSYVCHQFICKLPTTDPKIFLEQLNDVEKL